MNSALSLGHSRQPPTIDPVAVFGPSKFTPEDQAANPDKPMTRIVKDVVSVGMYNIGGPQSPELINFTLGTLQALANSVANQQAAGHAINLGYADTDWHQNVGAMIPASELIGPVDAAKVFDGTLWISAYVTPDHAKRLANPAMKVSQGMFWDYFDGDGNYHPIALVHVAVTDRPVAGGQGPFLAMANAAPSSQPPKGKAMNFAAVLAFINSLLGLLGIPPMPDDTNETNIEERGNFILSMLGGAKPAEGGEADPAADPDAAGGAVAAAMANHRKGIAGLIAKAVNDATAPLQRQVTAMSNQLKGLNGGAAQNAKSAFDAKLAELGKAGVAASILEEKKTLGELMGWDVRLLNGLQPSVSMSNVSRGGATANHPPNGGTDEADKPLSDEAMRARIKARGGNPDLMP